VTLYMLLKKIHAKGAGPSRKEAGASTEGKDERGQTALSYAVSQGSENTAKVLLEAGATVDSNTVERAFNSNHPSIFKILLEYSKDLPADIMELALFRAVQKNLHSVVAALIDRGTDVNAHNKKHYTPLLLACEMGKADKGMDDSATPLHIASHRGHADAARQLLHHKAPVNAQDKQAKSPLHLAAEQGHRTLAEMLLKAKADPNAQDKEKKTPLHAAALRGHLSIVELLLAKKGRAGAKDMDGCTPLHYATMKGNTDILKLLLASGKNKNINDRNVWRKTALHIAAEHGHGELINVLLSHGAAINASDSSRDTALHCACRAGHLSAVSALLSWARGEKANVLAVNSLRKTPLQVAEFNKTENQAQILTLLRKKMLIAK
uniref:Uncharacterized protein n=1 Tax=Junco hyemalis TaxID=40217 RepID=A0A8C5ID17_JUNHY